MAMRSARPRGKALTIPQVCKELSVDRRTVYQLIESGALPAYRVGKPYRIDPEDLAAFKDRQKAAARADPATGMARAEH